MKKFLLLVVVLFAGTSLFAQDVQFGAKGGLNFANWIGDDADGTDMRTDIHLGVFARFAINENIAFQPEMVYSRQGMKVDMGSDVKFKSNYLNIPLLMRAKMADKFHAIFGPQVGIHLNSEADDGDVSVDADNMKGLDLALALGLEYDIADNVAIGLRYNWGLSKVVDVDEAKVQNSVFQLGVSVAF
ncbi:porin family protein [Marinifilum fragile]|uniref:porin family protein n=1 Tax=Marinifilum fragile TaxID=570161 RepID=UPI0006D0303D|nr:porin family protein [Marinifilum fragile]